MWCADKMEDADVLSRVIVVCVLMWGLAAAGHAHSAPTFQELMNPAWFPDAQFGMSVDGVEKTAADIRIQTTGADIRFDLATGEVHFGQRISHPRPVARLHLGAPLEGARVTHHTSGMVRLTFDQPRVTVRINGDSLFMLHAHEALSVPIMSEIDTAWHASFKNNHLIVDEWGGFGLYTSLTGADVRYDPYEDTVAVYPMSPDAVLWVGVCPPKPYDWQRSFRDNVVWHWSETLGYPDDETLRSWQPHGNIVLLQSEVMLWKDWNLDFVPRLGENEFARVRQTLHDLGMRFIVYTSPYYFLRGTALEPAAMNSFEGFTQWPQGTPSGENMGLFLDAIRGVMAKQKPDGLYFDGQYTENPAALYALARNARAIVGETGLLEWHSTHALGYEGCYLPHADAYVDFILRGEGEDLRYGDMDYLRFFVSGYNIHNSIGVLCNNGPTVPTPDLVERVLSVNARFHTLVNWLHRPEVMEVLQNNYQPRLNAALQQEVELVFAERQRHAAKRAEAGRIEHAELHKEPVKTVPIFAHCFSSLPDVPALISPANEAPFSVADGTLHISAHAATHAYFRFPIEQRTNGFTVKLRRGSDRGESWGPAAMMRWPDGAAIRIGLRGDGLLQADIQRRQLLAQGHDAEAWVWLRVRWRHRRGVVEHSVDGRHYERLWNFEHGGRFLGDGAELLVGKVPYHGEPRDHLDPGPIGICEFASVEAFASE